MKLDFLKKYFSTKKAVYLDYAAATPVDQSVLDTMMPYFSNEFANPSAIHKAGVSARNVVENSRKEIAQILHVRPRGVIFTGSGTESNNLAIHGIVEALHADGRQYNEIEILSTRIEHPSVLEVLNHLEKRGVGIGYVNVDETGLINIADLKLKLTTKTALVTFAYVNSEIGAIQDIKQITRIVRAYNASENTQTRVHTDASQAPLWLPCGFDTLGVDLMTLDAGKCYGPKGVGVLAMRHGIVVVPQLLGGGQERGMRSGTENTALIVGCTKAVVRAQTGWKSRSDAVASLRDFMIGRIQKEIPTAILNGDTDERVANNINISIPGIDAEFAVITLDAHGIAASTKSACGGASSGSYVVREVTKDEKRAATTIRFTLGEETTTQDIEKAVAVLKNHVTKVYEFQQFSEK